LKKLVICALAAAFLAACAAASTPGDATPAGAAREAPKEDFVTGSRLRRESTEAPTSKEGGK